MSSEKIPKISEAVLRLSSNTLQNHRRIPGKYLEIVWSNPRRGGNGMRWAGLGREGRGGRGKVAAMNYNTVGGVITLLRHAPCPPAHII